MFFILMTVLIGIVITVNVIETDIIQTRRITLAKRSSIRGAMPHFRMALQYTTKQIT